MDVRLFHDTPADQRAWDEFVARSVAATSDHLWGWRTVLRDAFKFRPWYWTAVDGDRVVGILPLFQVPRGLGRCALSSIPFGNYGGICADTPEAELALLEMAEEHMARLHAEYLDLRHLAPVEDDRLQRQDLYNRFHYPLTGNPEAHFKAMDSSTRSNVRKAQRAGLTVKTTRDIGQIYPIHTHTTRRLGTPCFPRRYFDGIMRVFGEQAQLTLICHQDVSIAYELALIFKQSMVCQFNGSLEESLQHRPNQLRFWDSVQKGCAMGLQEIDYCRSRKDSGTAEFKRRLKFVEEPLGYQYLLPNGRPLPQRNPSNPKYQLVIRAWQRLPLALTQWVGPTVVRYLA